MLAEGDLDVVGAGGGLGQAVEIEPNAGKQRGMGRGWAKEWRVD